MSNDERIAHHQIDETLARVAAGQAITRADMLQLRNHAEHYPGGRVTPAILAIARQLAPPARTSTADPDPQHGE